MAYQKKYKCYRCGGKGKGVTNEWKEVFEKNAAYSNFRTEYLEKADCSYCSGNGYMEYDLRPQYYKGKFKNVNWEDLHIEYEDFATQYKCKCGGELFFCEADKVVCNCGRIYALSIKLSVDETHLNDMKYWEEYDEKD